MKTSILTISLLAFYVTINAQEFNKVFTTNIPENISNAKVSWVTIDSDTLMDLVITGITPDQQLKIFSYRNEGNHSFEFVTSQITGFKSGQVEYEDLNGDNQIDLIISGQTLLNTPAIFSFENQGDFSFSKNETKLAQESGLFRMCDLNQDGSFDFLLAGEDNTLKQFILKESTYANSVLATDISLTDILVFDFNNDGRKDFAISGSDANGSITHVYYTSERGDLIKKPILESLEGLLSVADYNHDGLFDLYGTGKNSNGDLKTILWINDSTSFHPHNSTSSQEASVFFTADVNSDGLIDQLHLSKNLQGEKINQIIDPSFTTINLDTTGIDTEQMGDHDRDGDLDLIMITDSLQQSWIKVYTNNTLLNERPQPPFNPFAISTFNNTFIFWSTPEDDHTESKSLTYDVWLGNNSKTWIKPSFDLATMRRMAVRHGNAGTNNFMIIRDLPDGEYNYQIQTVDNAFNGSYGFCGGGVLPCFDLTHEELQACKNDNVVLTGEGISLWFSTTHGLLGQFEAYNFVAQQNDTIFSVAPQSQDCAKNKIWIIQVNEAPIAEVVSLKICQGQSVELGIAPGWQHVQWNVTPVIHDQDTITVSPATNTTIIANAQSANTTCTYQKTFMIEISIPTMEVNGEMYQIMKGSGVQLAATGNVTSFLWEPPTGLSSTTIANPYASPSETTQYKVTGYDEAGCSIERYIIVQVEEVAFVPSLFTPNGDGSNDRLTLFGLSPGTNFKFQIFNREGILMYETTDFADATQAGWNGFAKGTRQPHGLYYWKIEGKSTLGEPLLLNGKKSGSILIVY